MRITVYGRGAHGSMPQAAVDPVVLAAMIVVRLQTVVSREVAAGGDRRADRGQHPGRHEEQRHPRPRRPAAQRPHLQRRRRDRVLDAIRRIVLAECQASDSPAGAGVRAVRPVPAHRQRCRDHRPGGGAFARLLRRPRRSRCGQQSASEDFSDIPTALGVPYTYWGVGGIDADTYRRGRAGRPGRRRTSRSTTPPAFAPVIQPTLDTGTQALVVAALAWLGPLTAGASAVVRCRLGCRGRRGALRPKWTPSMRMPKHSAAAPSRGGRAP